MILNILISRNSVGRVARIRTENLWTLRLSSWLMGNVFERNPNCNYPKRFERKSFRSRFILKTIKIKRRSKTNCPQFLIGFRCNFPFCFVMSKKGSSFQMQMENIRSPLVAFRRFVIFVPNFRSRSLILLCLLGFNYNHENKDFK